LPAPTIALLVIGTLGVSHALDVAAELAGLRDQSALVELERALAGASGVGFWLALLGIGLAPAFGEELLCRGLVQRGLEPRLGAAPAVLLSALFFGALHLEPVHSGLAAMLGLYLGTVAVLAGSIRAAILCHAVNNLVAVTLTTRLPELLQPGPATALAGLAVAAAALIVAARALRRGPASAPGLQPRPESDEI
jgi:membrane protease YdiL (CAAX protease family)